MSWGTVKYLLKTINCNYKQYLKQALHFMVSNFQTDIITRNIKNRPAIQVQRYHVHQVKDRLLMPIETELACESQQ